MWEFATSSRVPQAFAVSPNRVPPDKHLNEGSASLTRVLILVLPEKFGVFPGVFRVTAWFYHLLGHKDDPDTTEELVLRALVTLRHWASFYIPVQLRKPPDPVTIWSKCIRLWAIFRATVTLLISWWTMLFGTLQPTTKTSNRHCYQPPDTPSFDSRLLNLYIESAGSFPLRFEPQFALLSAHDELDSIKVQKAVASGILGHGNKVPLIFDTGASYTCSPNRDDFDDFCPGPEDVQLDGIASGLSIKGTGKVKYLVKDTKNQTVTLKLQAFWVPDLPNGVRLISPQGINTEDGDMGLFLAPSNVVNGIKDDSTSAMLEILPTTNGKIKTGWRKIKPKATIIIPYHPKNNLPVVQGMLLNNQEFQVNALTSSL